MHLDHQAVKQLLEKYTVAVRTNQPRNLKRQHQAIERATPVSYRRALKRICAQRQIDMDLF